MTRPSILKLSSKGVKTSKVGYNDIMSVLDLAYTKITVPCACRTSSKRSGQIHHYTVNVIIIYLSHKDLMKNTIVFNKLSLEMCSYWQINVTL